MATRRNGQGNRDKGIAISFSSPFAAVDIPSLDLVAYLFGDIADADLDRTALVHAPTGVQTSYGEMIERIDGFAGMLAARGIGAGDVVGLLAPNGSAFVIAFYGILSCGATATTINTLSTANEIGRQLSDSKAVLLLTVPSLREQAKEAAAAVGLRDVLIPDAHRLVDDQTGATAPSAPLANLDPATNIAVLPYSSGTTGTAKGVKLTHRNLVANVAQLEAINHLGADDAIIAVLPFFHSYGITVLLNTVLHARARLVIMPAFDLREFLATIQRYRCTVAFIAPPIAVRLAKDPLVDAFDLSSLRVVMCGAAPMAEELSQAVAARLDCWLGQGYGMTELSPGSHCIPFDGGRSALGTIAPPSSCGWTLPNAECKIVDTDTGQEVELPERGRSATGELWFRGPNVMAGYLGNDEATAQTIDAEGFLHTGDLASVDADGCVYIVDRLKELIKYKGYQVAPAELEALLLTHPSIADAAVVGVIDAGSGEEIPKAFVVVKPNADVTDDAVMRFVAEHVAPYKKVRQVEFIDVVPKSASGKILRKDLRDR
jgi:acyl-CoA synthetase (AMP-forming)/AMP-acid ligase II